MRGVEASQAGKAAADGVGHVLIPGLEGDQCERSIN